MYVKPESSKSTKSQVYNVLTKLNGLIKIERICHLCLQVMDDLNKQKLWKENILPSHSCFSLFFFFRHQYILLSKKYARISIPNTKC